MFFTSIKDKDEMKTTGIYKAAFITQLLRKLNNQQLRRKSINHTKEDFFNISIYKSKYENNNFMLIIKPQNFHFFIENNKLFYHPRNNHLDGVLKQYYCGEGLELAYNLPVTENKHKRGNALNHQLHSSLSFAPTIICHKKLKYLKSQIYTPTNIIKYRSFYDLQNPINAIHNILADIISNSN